MTEARDEDEWRKRIFAKLRTGPTAVLIDNLRRRLDSAALSSAITAYPTWEDRILGLSEIMRAPVHCLWLGTGNNPGLSHEMTRRTVRIRLDAKTDRPWLRTGFRHPNLIEWATANRPKLVWSALTMAQAWLAAGKPNGNKALGMFEAWAKVIGGILDVAGIDGFLGNLEEFYERADSEGAAWRAFVAEWWTRFRDADMTVSSLWPLVTEVELDLGNGSDRGQRSKFGKMLADSRDRTFQIDADEHSDRLSVRLEQAGTRKRAAIWKLRE
jgi:hypothetical protein